MQDGGSGGDPNAATLATLPDFGAIRVFADGRSPHERHT
jgi:hypothetical protein